MEEKEIKHEIRENKVSEEGKKKNNKLKIIGNTFFTIFMIVMTVLIFVAAQSRLTGREPTLLNHRLYVVDSGSMSPTIKVDAMIVVRESEPNEINKGDIITYYGHNKSSRVTHRVIDIENHGENFITKGDANEVNDPMPLNGKKLIGKVVFTVPVVGKVLRLLNTELGIGMLITLMILWIIVPLIAGKVKMK